MKSALLTLLISSCLLIACNGVEPVFYSFDYSRHNLTTEVGGKTVYFAIAVPESHYTESKKLPLIISLHYGGNSENLAAEYLDAFLLPALREYEAIYVAPLASSTKGFDNEESEAKILGLIDSLKLKYNIDEENIFVTGYSLGAIGAWYLASRNPDVFSAAIPVSGYIPSGISPENSNIPYYVIHSKADEIISFTEVSNALEQLKAKGTDIEFKELEGVSHYSVREFVSPLSNSIEWIRKNTKD